jgi:hypothetical protein
MPTKRTRRPRHRREEVSDAMWKRLHDEPISKADPGWFAVHFAWARKPNGLQTDIEIAWRTHAEAILADWTAAHPGTRPSCWWEFDAPRWKREDMPEELLAAGDGWLKNWERLPAPRRRLGGVGTPVHEALAYVPDFRLGIPTLFVDAWSVEYYNGRLTDVRDDDLRIGEDYREGDFPYHAIDPSDPPQYEAQAAYLQRQNLLAPPEARRLSEKDFEPELVLPRKPARPAPPTTPPGKLRAVK